MMSINIIHSEPVVSRAAERTMLSCALPEPLQASTGTTKVQTCGLNISIKRADETCLELQFLIHPYTQVMLPVNRGT